jgi:hypothetical protein
MKEWVKLISTGQATTRILSIPAELIRQVVPNATKDTEIYVKRVIENGKLVLTFTDTPADVTQ